MRNFYTRIGNSLSCWLTTTPRIAVVICAWAVVKNVIAISRAIAAANLLITVLGFDLNLDSPIKSGFINLHF